MSGVVGLPVWARVGPQRLAHITRVVALVDQWAQGLAVAELERDRWLRAAWLHDALRDADPSELAHWAPGEAGSVELWHGPAAATRAEAEGETDQGLLAAVRFHSVGSVDWDRVGQVLYCADYLEPGRPFERVERAALAARLPAEPTQVFFEVVQRRMLDAVRAGRPIHDSTVTLWNSLARAGGSRS